MDRCCLDWRNETDLYDEVKKRWYIVCNKCWNFKRYIKKEREDERRSGYIFKRFDE